MTALEITCAQKTDEYIMPMEREFIKKTSNYHTVTKLLDSFSSLTYVLRFG